MGRGQPAGGGADGMGQGAQRTRRPLGEARPVRAAGDPDGPQAEAPAARVCAWSPPPCTLRLQHSRGGRPSRLAPQRPCPPGAQRPSGESSVPEENSFQGLRLGRGGKQSGVPQGSPQELLFLTCGWDGLWPPAVGGEGSRRPEGYFQGSTPRTLGHTRPQAALVRPPSPPGFNSCCEHLAFPWSTESRVCFLQFCW